MLQKEREQKDKLPGVKLPENIKVSADLEETLTGRDVIVMAVPSPVVSSMATRMAPFIKEGQVIVNVAKGIEDETYKTLTEIIEEEIPGAVVCGTRPEHAESGKKTPDDLCCRCKEGKCSCNASGSIYE